MENPPEQDKFDLHLRMKLAMAIAVLNSRRHPSSVPTASELQSQQDKCDLDPRMKLAMAIAVLNSRRHHSSVATATELQSQPSCSNVSESDAIKWKRKSKQRKEEIMRLKEDLKLAEDGMHHDVFPENMMCKCYFFDDLGDISPKDTTGGAGSDQKRFSDVLQRRFLRQVRLSERKRKRDDCSLQRSCMPDIFSENEMDQLRASVDFLVELCENSTAARVEEGNFKNWSHQAVDYILATLKALSSKGNIGESVESIVSSLILHLTRRMCDGSQRDGHMFRTSLNSLTQHFRCSILTNLLHDISWNDLPADFFPRLMTSKQPERLLEYEMSRLGSFCLNWQGADNNLRFRSSLELSSQSRHCHNNFHFYIQHLLRKLGTDPYVGQRVILSVSQRIALVAESLLFMDPFDRAFPKMHNCMYITIQLIEFLVSDCLISWSTSQEFDLRLLEEWVTSIFHARKTLELLEGRNALYMLYMDRVVGDLTRQLGRLSYVHKLQPDILAKLFG